MWPNYCLCCLKKNGILISLKTKSSHKDGKTLLDYFNVVLGAYAIKEQDDPDFICMRCSKALQVSYHFINMFKKSKEGKINLRISKGEVILNSSSITEMHSKCEEKKSDVPPNVLVPLQLQSNLQLKHTLKSDAGPSDANKNSNLDFKCIICNKSFEDKYSFFAHNRQHHKDIVPYKCKLCNFYTCYTESLFKHCKKSHGLNSVALDLYQTKQVPVMAGNNPNFEITYFCLSCNFKACSQISIDEHLLKLHLIEEDKDSYIREIFNCPSCHRSFKNLKSAKIHYSMYHICALKRNNACNKRIFNCEICGKFFDLKSSLFLHRRICERRLAVNCNFCNLKFTSVLKYERHLQDKHSVAIKHECEICCKTFNCSEYLTVHRKRHNERYYQCDLCPKNYISNGDLKVHKQRIHANTHVAVPCATCGMNFPCLALLRNHESRAHNNKHFHQCVYCDFVSSSSSAVKIHQYKHTGKPYKCQLCPKEFAFRKVLRQHCEKYHSVSLSDEELAEMFKKSYGYTSRFDAFSKQNNSLEITEVNELGLEDELEEFGLTLNDIMDDLFDYEFDNKKLP